MTNAPPPAPGSTRPPASGPSLAGIGAVTLAAPIIAVLVKLPSGGWLMVFFFLSGLLWLGGYALLAVAVSRGMLRRQGQLRAPGARRVLAVAWALLTSVGVVVLGVTIVDGGDSPGSIQSTLTLMLGEPQSPSPAHAVSGAIAYAAAAAWIVGYIALVVEWIVAAGSSRQAAPPVPPPVVQPRVG
ncbi:MAG: hypothetical protein ACQEWM_03920 [Actinomycetota bacterium]